VIKALYFASALSVLTASAWAETDSAQKLEAVQTEIKQLNADLSANKADKEALYKQLKQQSKKISSINRQLATLNNEIKRNAAELKKLQAKQSLQTQAQEQQTAALLEQIRHAYIHSQSSYLKLLLNQNNPALLSRATTYYNYFHQARGEQLVEIEQTLANLTEKQKQIFSLQRQQQQNKAQQQSHIAAIEKENKQRQLTIAKIERSISTQDQRLAALKKQEQSLKELLTSLSVKPATKTTSKAKKTFAKFSTQRGQLSWPVNGKLLARYGSKRNLGKLTWKGIMISAPTGKDVAAVAGGEVVFADWLRGFGLLVIIDHGQQYMTLYGNNETVLRQVGETVAAGEIIAQSGAAGIHSKSGLYFELRHKGNPQNPLKWLNKKG
jgi:septal ring factor EnvC (AmiA/AmiB activator)